MELTDKERQSNGAYLDNWNKTGWIMETIHVRWDVNTTSGSENIPLEELGCKTIEEWNALDEDEQRERLQTALDELPERTSIIVDAWD